MLKIDRTDLAAGSLKYLAKLTQVVTSSDDPKATAASRWDTKSSKEFSVVKDALRKMCSGIERCMYCEDSLGTDIEHFWPKSKYPHHAFSWENYLLACSHCNSNEKREDLPLDEAQEPLAINPSLDDPLEHLALLPSGEYVCRTVQGIASVELFGLNRPQLVSARRVAWSGFAALAKEVWMAHQKGRKSEAELLNAAYKLPHGSVLVTMIQYAHMGTPIMDDELTTALCYVSEMNCQ
ncbi:HNH endonuclease [Pseudarthrobacter sp. LMD1-1-1.1]|uniref:HNH endonuclease n=1 Tax=Pseudarthrobacter sp. LMD1-1-1.1 TaxID=3135242 RepID=UPI00344098A5